MTKTINLYFDFEFTSLSPDAQPISLGIVSDGTNTEHGCPHCGSQKIGQYMQSALDVSVKADYICNDCNKLFDVPVGLNTSSKSFYAEFSCFDINRCDDWVKENVVGKLQMKNNLYDVEPNHWNIKAPTDQIIKYLKKWLWSFREYNIQFVTDCGTWDWYWMLQLLAEWEEKDIEEKMCSKCSYMDEGGYNTEFTYKYGLPKLPGNISPVPEDLNDLIARVKGISVREAFDLNREELAYLKIDLMGDPECFGKTEGGSLKIERVEDLKHNALFDARVIKEIYQKLK